MKQPPKDIWNMEKINEFEQRVIELEKKLAFLLDDGKRKKEPSEREKKLISILLDLSNDKQKASVCDIALQYGQISNQEIGYMLKGLGFRKTKKRDGIWIDMTIPKNKRALSVILCEHSDTTL